MTSHEERKQVIVLLIAWQCDFSFAFLSVMHDCSEQLNALNIFVFLS
jgi:hypothetical protein